MHRHRPNIYEFFQIFSDFKNLEIEKFKSKLKINTIKYDSNTSKIATIDNVVIINPYSKNIRLPLCKIQINDNRIL